MQSNDHKELWKRIRDFPIDDPVASVKYSDKLAYHNGWSPEYTARVIEEYRKFIFLCCILPNGASPSPTIDEAWHLHLTYTHNYWKGLCAGVLGKEIHHFPSKGGPEENEKHVQWYNDTLDSYREVFGHDAPGDIWKSIAHTKEKNTIIDKPLGGYREAYRKYLYLLSIPFLLILAIYGKIIPYNLTGPQFLLFYSCLIVAVIIYLLLIRSYKKDEIKILIAEKYKGDADLYQLARFVYGRERSLRAAVVDLVEREVLEPGRHSNFTFHSSKYIYSSSEKNPLAIHLLRNAKDGEPIHYTALSAYFDDASTYHAGLSGLYQAVSRKDFWPLGIAFATGLVGLARIIQGNYNDRPVSYLLGICMTYVFIMAVVISLSSGKVIFQQIFQDNFKRGGQQEFENTALASAFVFLGMRYVTGLDGRRHLESTFSKNRKASDSGFSSGCGSSDGGCGGGGGGCGGCGGGD